MKAMFYELILWMAAFTVAEFLLMDWVDFPRVEAYKLLVIALPQLVLGGILYHIIKKHT